jgi:hypothetical protein
LLAITALYSSALTSAAPSNVLEYAAADASLVERVDRWANGDVKVDDDEQGRDAVLALAAITPGGRFRRRATSSSGDHDEDHVSPAASAVSCGFTHEFPKIGRLFFPFTDFLYTVHRKSL